MIYSLQFIFIFLLWHIIYLACQSPVKHFDLDLTAWQVLNTDKIIAAKVNMTNIN